jgi:hypothetical protein
MASEKKDCAALMMPRELHPEVFVSTLVGRWATSGAAEQITMSPWLESCVLQSCVPED